MRGLRFESYVCHLCVIYVFFYIYIYIYIYIYLFFVFGAELRRIKEGFGDSRENFAIVKALSEGKPG